MKTALLFIPDISGFTKFVQNTEIQHSQHVISELLEVLINANTQKLKLAEIEGDALFFYKEDNTLSQEKLLAQVETMYTAFYSHLNILSKNRICNCNACATAPNLQLKIVAHSGELQFIDVHANHKPFGNVVIEAHRLLKNSVDSDNYVLISDALAKEIWLPEDYQSKLYQFQQGCDSYDSKDINYHFSVIENSKLQLKSFDEPKFLSFDCPAKFSVEKEFQVSASDLIEVITNYKYRHSWVDGVDEFIYNEDEVTRLGTEHICVINGKQLNFITVTKKGEPGQIVYGELTESIPVADRVYQFYIITPLDKDKCLLQLEVYWEAKSLIKKLMMSLFAKKSLRKNNLKALKNLELFLTKNTL
ncbi:MAG: hypothetical protein ACI9M9_001871 [Flavobacteriaceae bacterium]|jgi:hypothetical protein